MLCFFGGRPRAHLSSVRSQPEGALVSIPQHCPLCNAAPQQQGVVTRHVYGAKNKDSAFFHCHTCDVRYQHPGLTPQEEAHFYAAEFEGFMAGRSGAAGGWQGCESHIRANEPTRVRRMKYLAPYLRPGSHILEVGCSSGFMLHPLVKQGHTCVGVEPSGLFGEYVRNTGIPVYASVDELTSSQPTCQFDLVQHFFVLEHISQPLSFLQQQMKLLKSGGALVFEIPNVADPLYTLYDIPAFERFYWSVAHPWYFSEASLRYLLDQLGHQYEIKLDQRYDLSNHMIWARDGRPGGSGRFSSAFGAQLDEAYKQALVERRMCDTLIGVVRQS